MTVKKTKKTSKKSSAHTSAQQDNDKILAMLSHLLGLFVGIFGSLVIYLVKKDEKGNVARENAKHALNFQISLIIYFTISAVLAIVFIGFLTAFALGILALVTQVIGSIRAYDGKVYEYPLEIKFIN